LKAEAVIEAVFNAGGQLTVTGDRIHYRLPRDYPGKQRILDELREHKPEIIRYLKAQSTVPAMPYGVRLVSWDLKEPPVAIETCAVVIDPGKFAVATLGELRERLTNPRRKYGWTVPQLIDRLAQVGVSVALDGDKF
jgi:hypothetical protein